MTTHTLIAGIHEDGELELFIVCLNDPDDVRRDCRHGTDAPDCPDVAYMAPEGLASLLSEGWEPVCGGWFSEGEHIHAYTSTQTTEHVCGVIAWQGYTGEPPFLEEAVDLPSGFTVRWQEEGPILVPVPDADPASQEVAA